MTDYQHTKFGLIWSKAEQSYVGGGGIRPTPQVEKVLNSPGEIGLNYFLWEFRPFGPNLFMFGWDFTDSDNFEGQRSNVLKYPSDYLIQPPGKSIHHQ